MEAAGLAFKIRESGAGDFLIIAFFDRIFRQTR